MFGVKNKKTYYRLAHMNYARLRAPLDDPIMFEFRHAIDPINAIAKSTPGYIWSYDNDCQEYDDNDQYYGRGNRLSISTTSSRTGDAVSGTGNTSSRNDVPVLRDDPLLMPQLSLWADMESLQHFAYKSGHAMYLKRKREWFTAPTPPWAVCWWSHRDDGYPTLVDAFKRCEYLKEHGPSSYAFNFKTAKDYPMPLSSSTSSSAIEQ